MVKGKQFAGGFLSPEWINQPNLAEKFIAEAAAMGYRGWICFVRHMQPNVFYETVKNAVAELADIVHSNGMEFILDTDPTHWAEDVTSRDPESALWVILPVETHVYDGKFELFIKGPSTNRQIDIAEVSAIYAFDAEGAPVDISADFESKWQHAMIGSPGFDFRGKIANNFTGRIKFYLASTDTAKIDHASRTYLAMQRELLESYRHIPLDGIAWDEPGKGHGVMTSFRAGKDFFTMFKQTNGYELRQKLIYLDNFDDTPEAAKVRCDYYRTLSDMHYQAQLEHNELAKAIWGENIILGTHQTWSGLPTDLAAGVFDHFRLGELLTEAWTDGGFDLELKTAIFPFMLADSIKKGLGRKNAYYNDWAYRPLPGSYRQRNRLKTLFHINTFTHVYSDFSEGLVNLRTEPMKSCVGNDVQLLDAFDKLAGERRGVSDIAMWYGWEGYATLPKHFARAVYTFFQNTSLFLMDASRFADFVSSNLLFRAEMKNGRLCTANSAYHTLIMPYARVMPDGLWERIADWAENGLKVIFVGPEPAYSASGNRIDFAEKTGFCSYGLNSYDNAIRQSGVKLVPNAWEPAFLDIAPAVKVVSKEKCTIKHDIFGRQLMAEAVNNGICWIPGLDPREDLIKFLELADDYRLKVYSGNCIWRIFSDDDKNDFILVLAPRCGVPCWGLQPSCKETSGNPRPDVKIIPFDGIIIHDGRQYEFKGCEWAALHFSNGKIVDKLLEGNEFTLQEINQ